MRKIVCLVIENANLKSQAVQQLGNETEYEVNFFKGMDEFYSWSKGKKIHALVCEIKLTIKGQWESRKILNLLDKSIVVARVRWDVSTGEIIGIIQNESYVDGNFWDVFTGLIKVNNQGRLIRKEERREKFWGVEVVSTGSGLKDHLFNTRDVSSGGMFIIYSHPPAIGTELELRIAELEGEGSIKAVVRWVQAWGNKNNFPAGFGVEFTEISERQKEQIDEMIGNRIQFSSLEEIENLIDSKNKK